jgi:hypothetical protein
MLNRAKRLAFKPVQQRCQLTLRKATITDHPQHADWQQHPHQGMLNEKSCIILSQKKGREKPALINNDENL